MPPDSKDMAEADTTLEGKCFHLCPICPRTNRSAHLTVPTNIVHVPDLNHPALQFRQKVQQLAKRVLLKATIAKLLSNKAELEKKITKLDQKNVALKNKNQELKDQNAELKNQNAEMRNQNTKLKDHITELEKRLAAKKAGR
jgi:septal ring factor EnvC (AmiA/AmiB activator)